MVNDNPISWIKEKSNLNKAFQKLNEELIEDGQEPIEKEVFLDLVKELNITNASDIDLNIVRQKLANEVNDYLKKDSYYSNYSYLFYYEVKTFCQKCFKSLALKVKDIISKVSNIIQQIVVESEKEGVELDFSDISHDKLKLITVRDESMTLTEINKKIDDMSFEDLRIAFEDMLSYELDKVDNEHLKDFIKEKLASYDIARVNQYIENHSEDFANK